MKELIFTGIACLIVFTAKCQYSEPQEIYHSEKTRVSISFKMSGKTNYGGNRTCEKSQSFYKFYNETSCPNYYLTLKFDYINCDGVLVFTTVMLELSKQGETARQEDYFTGRRVVHVYDVQLKEHTK